MLPGAERGASRAISSAPTRVGTMNEEPDAARELFALLGTDPRHRHARDVDAVFVCEPQEVTAHGDAIARLDLDLLRLLALGHDDAAVGVCGHRVARAIAEQSARIDDVAIAVIVEEELVERVATSDLGAATHLHERVEVSAQASGE